jgi:hypothetical protein
LPTADTPGEHLERHVLREEAGVFSAMRHKGEFLDELTELEAEHRQFDQAITGLPTLDSDFANRLTRLLDDLASTWSARISGSPRSPW